MARVRDSELWEMATVVALGCATLLAIAYLLALWKPLRSARRVQNGGAFFARHDADAAPVTQAPKAQPAPSTGDLPMVIKDKLPAAAVAAAAPAKAAAASAPSAPAGDPASEAAAAGAPVDKAGLARAGQVDIFHGLIARVAAHPRVISFLLNNKTLNDALFSSRLGSKRCSDAAAFTDYLSHPNSKDPFSVAATATAFDALLKTPESARAMIDSDFATRVLACPGLRSVASDPRALTGIASANPRLAAYLLNPSVLEMIGASQRASSVLSEVQSHLSMPGAMGGLLGGMQAQGKP